MFAPFFLLLQFLFTFIFYQIILLNNTIQKGILVRFTIFSSANEDLIRKKETESKQK